MVRLSVYEILVNEEGRVRVNLKRLRDKWPFIMVVTSGLRFCLDWGVGSTTDLEGLEVT